MASRRSPFFIIGSPRSGTTLLRLMLTSNPDLVVPPECGFIAWLYPHFFGWKGANETNIRDFAVAVFGSKKFETWGLGREEIEQALMARRPRWYADACSAVYERFAEKNLKPQARWGDKNNYYLKHITRLSKIFVEARFVHIVRDGRDVACSYRDVMALGSKSPYRPTLPMQIGDIARQWSEDLREIRAQLSLLNDCVFFELRYEDLVSNPSVELERLCEWLGTRYTPEMLSFHQANQSNELEPKLTLDWKMRTLEPVSTSTIGRYRVLLSESEIAEFCKWADSDLRRYGYAT